MHMRYGCALEIVLERESDVRAVVALHPSSARTSPPPIW